MADPTSLRAKNVVCARCLALPKSARSALAREAMTRELESRAKDLRRERLLKRIDIGRTIDSVPLTDETWEWLNLVGHAITLAQAQARAQEANAEWFRSVDAYKVILAAVIAKGATCGKARGQLEERPRSGHRRRRRSTARPSSEVPSSASVPGSGISTACLSS